MKHTALLFALCWLAGPTVGFKNYQDSIPNGNQVPHPCKPFYIWQGVGHLNAGGGGRRNPFGQAFEAAGKRWTSDLCKADSDGDGRTNGEELGDPNCKWTPGSLPEQVNKISHPGVCEPFDSEKCKVRNSWVDCTKDELNCPALEAPDVKYVDLTMPRTKVPPNETYYVCSTLDLPLDDNYYVIGLKPKIDNQYIMHHSTVFGCTHADSGQEFVKPGECGMGGLGTGCGQLITLWTLGSPGHCFQDNVGIAFGKTGIKRIVIQHHWTNPEHRTDWYDSSGVRLYYTTKARQYEGGTFNLGQQSIIIPPGVPSMDVKGVCSSKCTKEKLPHNIYIADALMHAHYLGKGIKLHHKRGDEDLGDIVNDTPYSYDNPIFHSLKPAREIRPGDELTVTCTYQSMTRKTTTEWGLGTYDEMCYAILFYYPRMPLETYGYDRSCVPFEDIQSCSDGEHKGCKNVMFQYYNFNETLVKMEEVLRNCPEGRCDITCSLAVKKLSTHPCLQGVNYKYQKWLVQYAPKNAAKDEFFRRWDTLKTCRFPQHKSRSQIGHLKNVVIG